MRWWIGHMNEEKIREIVGAVLQPFADEQVAHAAECKQYRKGTRRELKEIKKVLKNAAAARDQQHLQNLSSLKWQRNLSITMILAIVGFLSTQIFLKTFESNNQTTSTESSSTSTRSK